MRYCLVTFLSWIDMTIFVRSDAGSDVSLVPSVKEGENGTFAASSAACNDWTNVANSSFLRLQR